VSKSDKAHIVEALRGTWEQSAWNAGGNPELRDWLVDHVLVHAKHPKYWGVETKWADEYTSYAQRVARESGKPAPPAAAALADTAMLERFVGHLARSGRGRSVPRAARRHLSGKRKRAGLTSLNENPFIAMLVSGAERAQPSRPSQAADIGIETMAGLSRAVRPKEGWFRNMVATMAMMGYLTLMRLVELRGVALNGLVFITTAGERLTERQARKRPRSAIRGVLIHVAWRKSSQDADAWIPLSCKHTLGRILDHCDRLERIGYGGTRLFPSRTSASIGATAHPVNRIGSKSFVNALRRLLVTFKLLTSAQAQLVRGHSLRVGGSNNCRRQGISDETHRLIGGWASLTSSADYMALSTQEQFKVTDRMVAPDRVTGFVVEQQALAALRRALPTIGGMAARGS
jgi:hypothetical protein